MRDTNRDVCRGSSLGLLLGFTGHIVKVVRTPAKWIFVHLNRSSRGWKGPAGGRAPLVAAVALWLGPDPSGYNGAVGNVLSVDGGAACGGRKECGDRGHVC